MITNTNEQFEGLQEGEKPIQITAAVGGLYVLLNTGRILEVSIGSEGAVYRAFKARLQSVENED